MKVRNEKDRIELNKKIELELGIDIEKYRTEEIAETIFELLSFPKYILTYTIRPIIFSILVFIIGFFLIDLIHIEYLIYTLIGAVLFIAVGILLGLIFLTNKIKGDMGEVMNLSIKIFNDIINDLKLSKKNLDPNKKGYQFNLLFQGVVHNITIPVITESIADRIPLIGGLIKRIIFKILSRIANIVNFDKPSREVKEEILEKGEETVIEDEITFFSSLNKLIDKTLNTVFKVTQFPIKILLGIMLIILLIFIYLIN